MSWIKHGQIFSPNGNYDWMHHYAAQVSAIEFDQFIRLYFTTRSKLDDKGNYETRITFLDCDKENPTKILNVHNQPLLPLGQPGTFDEHGTMMCEIIKHQDKYWLYYLGWQRSSTVPYITTLGLALSDDGVNFTKVSEGPIIGVSKDTPYGVAKVSILLENDQFNMWYTHYTPWIPTGNTFRPDYDIRFASSENGIDWKFRDKCLNPNKNESLATPCVRKINNTYHMWYGYRPGVDENGKSGAYKIGYATSINKNSWIRVDDNAISTSDYGWDYEMICYPYILQLKNKLIMFYSGNHYGKEGFGYATLDT
jgi:predicted GH43/DUF377 family glycosyl hydrolase